MADTSEEATHAVWNALVNLLQAHDPNQHVNVPALIKDQGNSQWVPQAPTSLKDLFATQFFVFMYVPFTSSSHLR
jgi:hypothetical protein